MPVLHARAREGVLGPGPPGPAWADEELCSWRLQVLGDTFPSLLHQRSPLWLTWLTWVSRALRSAVPDPLRVAHSGKCTHGRPGSSCFAPTALYLAWLLSRNPLDSTYELRRRCPSTPLLSSRHWVCPSASEVALTLSCSPTPPSLRLPGGPTSLRYTVAQRWCHACQACSRPAVSWFLVLPA